MRTLVSSVIWRYIAIFLQFGVLILIARRTQIDVAGVYFALFGFVTVTAIGVGLGLPDGLVRHLPAGVLSGQVDIKSVVFRSIVASIGISGLLAALGTFAALRLIDLDKHVIFLTTAWWLAYALTFLFAQVLVGLNRAAAGAFIAYSSISIGYSVTLVPYIITADHVTLIGLLYSANAGAWVAGIAGFALVIRRSLTAAADYRSEDLSLRVKQQASIPISALLSTGFPIMLGRCMQASLPWIPAWVLIVYVSAEEAAVYSAASRLTVAVTSVVAALRFSVRPSIVELNLSERYDDIVILNRKCSILSAVPPVAGTLVLLVAGYPLVVAALGVEYAAARNILLVLMLGVLAEAFGGMSDEILKMTNRTRILLLTLFAAVLFQATACYLLAPQGAQAVAFATAAAFAIQYIAQVVWLSIRTPIKILPLPLSLRRRMNEV